MKIEKLSKGNVVFDKRSGATAQVLVEATDLRGQRVLARIDAGNMRWYTQRDWKNWTYTKPDLTEDRNGEAQ